MLIEVPNPSPITAPFAVSVVASAQAPLGERRKKITAPLVDGGMGNPATMPVRVTASSPLEKAIAAPKPMTLVEGAWAQVWAGSVAGVSERIARIRSTVVL